MMKFRSAMSSIEDFGEGLRFQKVIDETATDLVPDSQVRRLILCSGQVYYDLEAERNKRGIKDIAIVRVEQISPFPFRHVERSLKRYTNAEVMWTQEEPKNQGMWSFVEPRIRNHLAKLNHKSTAATFSGRVISASTATGYGKTHAAELAAMLDSSMA